MTEIWILLATSLVLAVAVGLDLYWTLFLVSVAPYAGWEVPTGLGGLATPLVIALAGSLWVMEAVAERWPAIATFWHLVQALARPVAAGLLAFLVLDGVSTGVSLAITVPLTGAALALLVHAAKGGWFLLGWLTPDPPARPAFVSALEDTVTLGLVALAFDAPLVGGGVVVALLLALVLFGGALLRAGGFAYYLAWSRSWGSLRPFRWAAEDDLPGDLAGEVAAIPRPLGHRLKVTRAAGLHFPGTGVFRSGWVVLGPADPRWVCRTLSGPRMQVLDPDGPLVVGVEPLFSRITVGAEQPSVLIFPRGGPTVDTVMDEIGASMGRSTSDGAPASAVPEAGTPG